MAVPVAGMVENRVDEILRTTVVEKEETLPQSPERSGTKFISLGLTLDNVVGKAWSHVMEQKIGVEVCLNVAERRKGRLAGGEGRVVAERASNLLEDLGSVLG